MQKPHYIKPHWPAPNNIHAYTTTRQEGHSKAPFNYFNLSTREPINTQDALANRELLKSELHLKNEPIWLNQVHGTHAIQACLEKDTDADASYTHTYDTICTVLTADCLPLLLCDKAGTEVAAIHAGWRGLQAGVIEATCAKLSTPPSEWLVWLGPAIGPRVFEVGDEVRDLFMATDPVAQEAFAATANKGKWLCNIYMLAKQRLAKLGVQNIYGGERCTYTEAEDFYSFRRDGGLTGRMASLIWIQNPQAS